MSIPTPLLNISTGQSHCPVLSSILSAPYTFQADFFGFTHRNNILSTYAVYFVCLRPSVSHDRDTIGSGRVSEMDPRSRPALNPVKQNFKLRFL